MKALALVILLSIGLQATVNQRQHIALHAGISFVSAHIAYEYGFTNNQSALIGFFTSALIGIGKELYDTNLDNNDIIANTIGGAVGVAPVLFIYKF